MELHGTKNSNLPLREDQLVNIWYSLLDVKLLNGVDFSVTSEEECAFSMLLQVLSSQFKKLYSTISRLDNEKADFQQELTKVMLQCAEKSAEIEKLKNKKCELCHHHEQELKYEQEKYERLEKQMKKCAFMLNTSLDSDDRVLEKVRGFVSQSILDIDESHGVALTPLFPEKPKIFSDKDLITPKYNCTPEAQDISPTDVLVPGTPEKMDVTNICEDAYSDNVVCVPETAPFNFDDNGAFVNPHRFFGTKFPPPSPIIRKQSNLHSTIAKNPSFPAPMNDSMFYSPPMFNPTKQCKEEESDDEFQTAFATKKASSKTSFSSQSARSKEPLTFTPKRSKLKQSKLNLQPSVPTSLAAEVQPGPSYKVPKVPPLPEEPLMKKSKRRIKGPEDWTCKECLRLFRESNIDTSKLKPSMNFCPEHRNRYTYYLGTPPEFWNPNIVGLPRQGRVASSPDH